MKTQLINNVVSQKELFFIYNEIVSSPNWQISGRPTAIEYPSSKQFSNAPLLMVKSEDGTISNYALYLYIKSLVYRLEENLKNKKVGIHTKIKRTWFNITYNGCTNHWLHQDFNDPTLQTVLMFMTPVWQEAWKGCFHVDGEKYKFTSGSAVIFNSNEFHSGEEPETETNNWLRLTLNIVLEK